MLHIFSLSEKCFLTGPLWRCNTAKYLLKNECGVLGELIKKFNFNATYFISLLVLKHEKVQES